MAALGRFSDVRRHVLNIIFRNKKLTIIIAVCFSLAFSFVHIHSSLGKSPAELVLAPAKVDCGPKSKELDEKRRITGKNWIVVTTINQPTDAMDLLCNLKGWNVVVVADTKSPNEWTCGSCVYLSVEDQQCLDYDIVKVIPYRAYTRKNIGYLWAIQQGATKVFDTDDDNLPTGNDIIFEPPTDSVVGYRHDNTIGKSINIYSHFGRPDIWPRGFPLEDIDIRRPVSYMIEYDAISEEAKDVLAPPMMVQQGLADLDPDVDAVFRLTQSQELKHAKFCKKSPSIRLSPGTFCPFNSQNTLFSYDAFWGLVLPISVSFRVCDIWRGYWVQRLLWDVNGSLGFTKPTVDQIRNAHNYLDDYMDELQIYDQTSKFIDFLSSWNSTSTRLETRIIDLMTEMAKNKFIGEEDVDLAKRWVKDLQNINYAFPKVSYYDRQAFQSSLDVFEERRVRVQKSHQLSSDALKECQQEAVIDPSMSRIQITKGLEKDPSDRFKDILLVVNFNHPDYKALDPYLSIYKPYFPNIRVYGPQVPAHLKNQVIEVEPYDGGFTSSYRALADAMEKYPNFSGYLYTNDDTVLNVFQLAEFDQDKVWKKVPGHADEIRDRSKPPPNEWHWLKSESTAMWNDPTSFTDDQRKRISAFTKVDGPADIKAYSDAVYVPSRIAAEVADVLKRFAKHSVFLELAIGLALVAVESPENWVDWQELYLWIGGGREFWRDHLKPGVSMLHPVKLMSDPKAKNYVVRWIETVEVV